MSLAEDRRTLGTAASHSYLAVAESLSVEHKQVAPSAWIVLLPNVTMLGLSSIGVESANPRGLQTNLISFCMLELVTHSEACGDVSVDLTVQINVLTCIGRQ
jgi:hypothetical protein